MGFASGCDRICCAACAACRVICENDCNSARRACEVVVVEEDGAFSDLCNIEDLGEYGFGVDERGRGLRWAGMGE